MRDMSMQGLMPMFSEVLSVSVNEFRGDMNVKGSIPTFRELLSPSGSASQDVRDRARLKK